MKKSSDHDVRAPKTIDARRVPYGLVCVFPALPLYFAYDLAFNGGVPYPRGSRQVVDPGGRQGHGRRR